MIKYRLKQHVNVMDAIFIEFIFFYVLLFIKISLFFK